MKVATLLTALVIVLGLALSIVALKSGDPIGIAFVLTAVVVCGMLAIVLIWLVTAAIIGGRRFANRTAKPS
jgi:hypothetical protein